MIRARVVYCILIDDANEVGYVYNAMMEGGY